MKKILVFASIFLLSFVLAGCDLIPEDVIDQIKEYEGIEETLLMSEVELFIRDLEDTTKTNEDVCMKWYDGVDDDCDGIIEDVRTRFKAGSDLSKKVNILDDDSDDDSILEAHITFEFNGHVTVLKIMLDIDNSVSALKVMIKSSEIVFTPNVDTASLLEKYIDDLQDPEISDDEVCRIWSNGTGIDDDCNLRAANCCGGRIKHQFVLKTITPPMDNGGDPVYEATFKSDFNGHVTVLKIAFTEDDSSGTKELHISNLQQDVQMEFYPKPETEMLLEKLLVDLMNPDMKDEELCKLWSGDIGMDNDCNLRANKCCKLVFVLKTIKPSGDNDNGDPVYEAVLENDANGHVTVLKIAFTEDDTSGELKLMVHEIEIERPDNYYLNSEETLAEFTMFIADYLNPDISFDTLNENYFDGMLSQSYRIGRNSSVGDYGRTSSVTIGTPVLGMDDYYKISVTITKDDATEDVLEMHVKYIRKTVQEVKNKMVLSDEGHDNDCDGIVDEDCDGIDNDCDGIDDDCNGTDETRKLYEMFLAAYNDKTISRDILKKYFGVIPPESYFDMREKYLGSETKVALVDVVGPIGEGVYVVVYDIINGDESTRHHEPIKIGKRIDQSTPLLSILDPDDDGDGIPTEEKASLLAMFKNDLNDDSMDVEEVCLTYTGGPVGESCCPVCRPPVGDRSMIDSIELMEMNGESFIEIVQNEGTLESSSTYMIFFFYSDEKALMFKLIPHESLTMRTDK